MKIKIGLCIAAALLLTGASVFEGSAKVISERELPETDYYVATNKFPNNTIVDIINIENGKTVRATVISGLETPSLLAAISRSTANAIGLPEQSTGRIRMIEASDSTRAPADFVFLTEPKMESVASPAPAFVTEPEWADDFYYEGDELPPVITPPRLAANTEIAGEETSYEWIDIEPAPDVAALDTPEEVIAHTPDVAVAQSPGEASWYDPLYDPPEAISEAATDGQLVQSEQEQAGEEQPQPVMASQQEPVPETETRYVLVPDVERPPHNPVEPVLPPEYFIPPIEPASTIPPRNYDDYAYTYIPPIPPRVSPSPVEPDFSSIISMSTISPAISQAPSNSSPQLPLIRNLESGKYYVQLGTSTKVEQIQDEIIRIGMAYPVAVQNIGSDDDPLFRILLGPLNSGESGAMLQRFKSIGYKDAFVRRN